MNFMIYADRPAGASRIIPIRDHAIQRVARAAVTAFVVGFLVCAILVGLWVVFGQNVVMLP